MTGAERFNSYVHVLLTSFLTHQYHLLFQPEVVTTRKTRHYPQQNY